ncbi:MAG: hypothetical protein AAFY48_02070 [Bacteroidota bacterium]
MKILKLVLVAAGLLLIGFVQAQTADADITKSQIIAASADEVWERLRELDFH